MDTAADTDAQLYDARFSDGYMSDGSYDNTARVRDFLRAVLPPDFRGRILDFGCGTGRYAAILKAMHPAAEVFGTDVSATALEIARRDHPEITFVPLHEISGLYAGSFDLVVSNHVLEHVTDIEGTARLIASLAAPGGRMAHMMPCGNAGSLEHKLMSLVRDGISAAQSGRYSFEDPGHLRRLTSEQLASLFHPYGFTPSVQWFSGQFWDGLNWITESPTMPFKIAPIGKAVGLRAGAKLAAAHLALILVGLARQPSSWLRLFGTTLPRHPITRVAKIIHPLGIPMDRLLLALSRREWVKNRTSPNGSGMFLYFERH